MPIRPARPPKPPTAERVADAVLLVLGVGGAALSGWSLTTLMLAAGAPAWVAVLALTVLDGVALLAGVLVYLRRGAPHTAGGAQLVLILAVLASAVVNGAHGYVMPGGGWMAAVVLAAAPLAWEVGFALRHRALTVLVWLWWGAEARTALRREAWERIAPPAEEAAVTLERADRPAEVPAEVLAALEESGFRIALAEAIAERGDDLFDLADATREPARNARRVQDDVLARAVASLVSGVRTPDIARPDTTHERVPDQVPRSIAAGTRELTAAGITDPEVIAARLSRSMGRAVSPDTVRKEISRQAKASAPQTGQYL
jgi:hypothetical protein